MIGYKAWFIPEKGRGAACPVMVVDEEGDGLLVVWKLIGGIVLERVVMARDVYVQKES